MPERVCKLHRGYLHSPMATNIEKSYRFTIINCRWPHQDPLVMKRVAILSDLRGKRTQLDSSGIFTFY